MSLKSAFDRAESHLSQRILNDSGLQSFFGWLGFIMGQCGDEAGLIEQRLAALEANVADHEQDFNRRLEALEAKAKEPERCWCGANRGVHDDKESWSCQFWRVGQHAFGEQPKPSGWRAREERAQFNWNWSTHAAVEIHPLAVRVREHRWRLYSGEWSEWYTCASPPKDHKDTYEHREMLQTSFEP